MRHEPLYSNFHRFNPPTDAIASCVAATTAAVNAIVGLAVIAMTLMAYIIANPGAFGS